VVLNQQSEVTIAGTKAELVEILNQLEADLRRSIANSQDQQVRVGVKLADFLGQILLENTTLQKIEADEERNLESLNNQLITALTASAICKSRLQQLQVSLQGTQSVPSPPH
jgi:hypothetical protein